jgi:hypothetical protein
LDEEAAIGPIEIGADHAERGTKVADVVERRFSGESLKSTDTIE